MSGKDATDKDLGERIMPMMSAAPIQAMLQVGKTDVGKSRGIQPTPEFILEENPVVQIFNPKWE